MPVLDRRRLLALLVIFVPALSAAQTPPFAWDAPATPGQLTLTELTRDNAGGSVAVTYGAEAHGLPAGKHFQFWIQRAGEVSIGPFAASGPDARGTVRAFWLSALGVAPGEIVRVALASDDGSVRLFAEATPLPSARGAAVTPGVMDEPALDVSIDFGDRRWQPADNDVYGGFAVTKWVIGDDDADTAPEAVTTTIIRRQAGVTPEQLAASTRRSIERQCVASEWHTFDAQPDDVAYAWTARRCADGLPRIEIARVLDVDGHLVRITYSAHAPDLSPSVAASWLERFQAAKVWRRPTTR